MTERQIAFAHSNLANICRQVTARMATDFVDQIFLIYQVPNHGLKVQTEYLAYGGRVWEGGKEIASELSRICMPWQQDFTAFKDDLGNHLFAQTQSERIADISVGVTPEGPLQKMAITHKISPLAFPRGYRDVLFVRPDSPLVMWRERWTRKGLQTEVLQEILSAYRANPRLPQSNGGIVCKEDFKKFMIK